MQPTLESEDLQDVLARLAGAHQAYARRFPGDSPRRQPVHTVYGGAHLFRADTCPRLGELARAALSAYAPDPHSFGVVLGLGDAAETIYPRVQEKLDAEPVEDFRIDFEDGFGIRSDEEEDATVAQAARAVAEGMAAGTLPPFIGIRIKPFNAELHGRGIRTLDLFLSTLLEATGGALPDNFVVTLPKVTAPEHAAALDTLLSRLEEKLGRPPGTFQLELMIEVTQSIIGPDGSIRVPQLIEAAGGRCTAVHFGTYDYTASCNITAAYQHMTHPACDFARHVMQVSTAGMGVWLSDGATNVMPVAPHRPAEDGTLTAAQRDENLATVHAAWRLHYDHIRHSLEHAYYQGWDLHPAQLPTRYAAVYAFFLEGLDAASERLKNFIAKAAQATLLGDVFDDAATGQGLLNYFLRGINCGAITEDEALATGVTLDELRGRSFLKILENRRQL